jgi:flagellar biosynthesis/type III secretory pathway chaperone
MSPAREPTLAESLAAEQRALEALQALIEREREALARFDPEALAQAVAGKSAALSELEALAAQRDSALMRAGLPPGAQGVRRLEPTLPQAAALLAAARATRAANAANGTRLALYRAHVARALSVLAQATHPQAPLYTANGLPATGCVPGTPRARA